MKDRKSNIIIRGKSTVLTYLESKELPEFHKITSATIIPFLSDGKIVAALLERGIDIPGGHRESYDKTLFDILQRECMEEVGITLKGNIKVIQVVSSDYYQDESFMIVAAGFVDKVIKGFKPTHESLGREIVTIEEFIQRYNTEMKKEMTTILLEAKKCCGKNSVPHISKKSFPTI